MSKGKVLFIDTAHSFLRSGIESLGYECDYFADYNRSNYLEIAHKYSGIIVRSKIKLDKEFLEKCTNLKFIGRVGAGMENIDTEVAESKGIKCLNAPEGNRDAVAEQAIGMLLALFNRLLIADSEVRSGIWIREGNRGYEIGGKTIGIIGYGNTGSAFAQKLVGFDARILAYDKYKTGFSNNYVQECELEDIFNNCDVVSLHVPLTDETRYMINTEFIDKFKKNIYIINTSRGKVLKVSDLTQSIEKGKVLGACLDVLEFEGISFEKIDFPEDFKKLTSLKNVVLTPHIAGWTHESNIKMANTLVEKIRHLTY